MTDNKYIGKTSNEDTKCETSKNIKSKKLEADFWTECQLFEDIKNLKQFVKSHDCFKVVVTKCVDFHLFLKFTEKGNNSTRVVQHYFRLNENTVKQ